MGAAALTGGTFVVVGATTSPASAHTCAFAHFDHYHVGIQGHWTHAHMTDYSHHVTLGGIHYNVYDVTNHGRLTWECGSGNVGH